MYGSFVRAVREARGLTQQELASVSGVAASNISAIERGHRVPSSETLNRLLVACGFELAAVAGDQVVYCPLPSAGWFPDDDVPPPDPGDPADLGPSVGPAANGTERARLVAAVLDAVDAIRR